MIHWGQGSLQQPKSSMNSRAWCLRSLHREEKQIIGSHPSALPCQVHTGTFLVRSQEANSHPNVFIECSNQCTLPSWLSQWKHGFMVSDIQEYNWKGQSPYAQIRYQAKQDVMQKNGTWRWLGQDRSRSRNSSTYAKVSRESYTVQESMEEFTKAISCQSWRNPHLNMSYPAEVVSSLRKPIPDPSSSAVAGWTCSH